jgi:recombinational DNA repair ATPase RecF
MRLIEVEVSYVRGICHLKLQPNGRNLVIWGPNGSGKSAVVDALDFLLTGRIARLTGSGTGGIRLNRHGPHIDHQPEEATVRAVIQVKGCKDLIEISRCIAHPADLSYPAWAARDLEPILALAKRGQHVLTRREILRFITAEPSDRAQGIQELLDISEIEEIRKSLVKAQNDLEKELKVASGGLSTAKTAVNTTVQCKVYSDALVLDTINRSRTTLGGQPTTSLSSSDLKNGLVPPMATDSTPATKVAVIANDLQKLKDAIISTNRERLAKIDTALRDLVTAVLSNPEAMQALAKLQLTKLGMDLLDDSGACPLCEHPWPPDELRGVLNERLALAEATAKVKQQIDGAAAPLKTEVDAASASLDQVINSLEVLDLLGHAPVLKKWRENLQAFSKALSDPVDAYSDSQAPTGIERLFESDAVSDSLNEIAASIGSAKIAVSPEQVAWDTLTRLEENLKAVEKASATLVEAEASNDRATILLASFVKARDAVLGHLYDSIRERFVGLYRQLHNLDEKGFTAKIEPIGAGLSLEVDFLGRATHPPHALHSEGHQDTMGLCLYLALAEYLTNGVIDLILLDDVVMSVDADHRRQLCSLLASCFPERQFLITTHDKTWTTQLRTEGVVTSKQVVEFCNWSIEAGPQVHQEAGLWQRIQTSMHDNHIPEAAAMLRRGAEEYYASVCDALEVPVVYRQNGRWELGDYVPAAMHCYKKLIQDAIMAARSWGNVQLAEDLELQMSRAKSVFSRVNAEQWAVNASVHYNNWAYLQPAEFEPVVEAFQDLSGLFYCGACGAIIKLAKVGGSAESLVCNCGNVNWKLVRKPKDA